jgi:preprotein translocase subunit SecG
MDQFIIVIHVLLGLGIIGLIMMQQGRGADAGAGFGAGASGSVFGAQGSASFLSRMTAIFATLFFITSLGLAWINGHRDGSNPADIMSGEAVTTETALPGSNDDKSGVPTINIPAAEETATEAVTPPVATPQPVPSATQPATVAPAPANTPPADAAKEPAVTESNPAPVQPDAAVDAHKTEVESGKAESAPAHDEKSVKQAQHHGKKASKSHNRKN